MEVHHHPHVEKKSFKEYLLEGLMIFLAVSMGFFAESFRESLINSEKEHHLMEMMVGDLKQDTSQITKAIRAYLNRVNQFDTLRTYVIKSTKGNLTSDEYRKMYYIHRGFGGVGNQYFSVERALVMIEKEGFGLIRKQNITDSILNHREWKIRVEEQKDLILKVQDIANTFSIQIFDIELMNDYVDIFKAKEILKSTSNFKLLTNNPSLLKTYAYSLFRQRSAMYNLTIFLNSKKASAERLIELIQKEYHLEKE